jgi:hypothetical protein
MPATVRRYTTERFVEWAPLIALGALGSLAIAGMASTLLSRQLLRQTVTVPVEETVTLPPVQPRQSPFGALRIDATANLPNNTWAVFEVQLLDQQGNLLASAIKQGWRESGTWVEEGESGTWSEQDLAGRFDIRRASIDGPVTVGISVLEQGNTGGGEVTQPVTFQVQIQDGVIDGRFLINGVAGVLMMSVLAVLAVKKSGKVVIAERINDSDVGGRGRLGGPNKLVRMTLKVIGDENTPGTVTAHVFIKDSYGKQIYSGQIQIGFFLKTEDRATGYGNLDFIFDTQDSYGFYVEIMPDGPIDWTHLTVKEGARTLLPTSVIHLPTPTQ